MACVDYACMRLKTLSSLLKYKSIFMKQQGVEVYMYNVSGGGGGGGMVGEFSASGLHTALSKEYTSIIVCKVSK